MDFINDRLIQEMVKRQEAQEAFDPPPSTAPAQPTKEIGPKTALLMGSLADSASTYAFLKRGNKREGNPALQYMNGNPWSVIPTAAAGALGYNALHGLISKKSPKVANTLAGLLGGYHTALAASNMEPTGNSYGKTVDKLQFRKK